MDVKEEVNRRKANTDKILAHLKEHGKATNAQLIKIGGYRYAARIFDLRKKGWLITTRRFTDGHRKAMPGVSSA